MCPYCRNPQGKFRRKGYFAKKSTRSAAIQRYQCLDCRRSWSDQTGTMTYRQKKPHFNQPVYRLICSGMSQARVAVVLGVRRKTVARKISVLARFARRDDRLWTERQTDCTEFIFDEVETFEHSKCKPVSIGIAVRSDTREIIGIVGASMPAKSKLAARSVRKYGRRPDNRPHAMRQLMEIARTTYRSPEVIKSDRKSTYPRLVRTYFPGASHQTSKGRRGCVVGQGELKRGGYDPLFTLNHTCAMLRDNLKTMSRRTWCTAKSLCYLQDLFDLARHFHNRFVVYKIRLPVVSGSPIM